MDYININGRLSACAAAKVGVDNGAFRYGYGLFETMLVRGGEILLWPYHAERLFHGLARLQLEPGTRMNPVMMQQEIIKAVHKNKCAALCRVRLQFFAGGGGLYGKGVEKAGYVIECFELQPEVMELNENGLVTGIASWLHKSIDTLSDLKTCNALVYAMAARQAMANKWNDALITNSEGAIIESTIANLFWIEGDNIYTPPLADGCIAGVMRRHILALIPAIKEESAAAQRLLEADAVFLTNAVKRIKWVGDIGGRRFEPGKVRKMVAGLQHSF